MTSVPPASARPVTPPPRPRNAGTEAGATLRPPARDRGPSAAAIARARKTLEDQLGRPLPAVPADKAGKERWLEGARARQNVIKQSLEVLRDGWFKGNLPFETYTGYSRRVWDFDSSIRDVEYDLRPPAPSSPAQPGSEECPPFLTPGLVGAMNKHPDSPLNVLGVIALPFTMLLDGMNGLSRLGGACKKRPAPPAPGGEPAAPEKPAAAGR